MTDNIAQLIVSYEKRIQAAYDAIDLADHRKALDLGATGKPYACAPIIYFEARIAADYAVISSTNTAFYLRDDDARPDFMGSTVPIECYFANVTLVVSRSSMSILLANVLLLFWIAPNGKPLRIW